MYIKVLIKNIPNSDLPHYYINEVITLHKFRDDYNFESTYYINTPSTLKLVNMDKW